MLRINRALAIIFALVTGASFSALDFVSVAEAATYSRLPRPTVVLTAPTELAAATISHKQIDLTWTDRSSNEDGYRVERSLDSVTFTTVASLVANSKQFSDMALQPDTTYTYRVVAYSVSKVSSPSNLTWAITEPDPALVLPPPNPITSLSWGINGLSTPTDPSAMRERFRKARSLGVTEVRLDWEWRRVEAVRGEYRWTDLDALVQIAWEEGVSILPIVHYAPDWALRTETKPGDTYEMAPREDSFPDYARFLLASINRYGPTGTAPVNFTPISYWEVWNEPNTPQFWGPAPDPTAFARLMRTVQTTLAPVRNQVHLVHAGLAKADLTFLWQLFLADASYGDTFDILGVHPYLFDAVDGIREPDAMDADDPAYAALGFIGSATDPGFLGKVFNLQLLMSLFGAADKPIWITEMGYFVSSQWLGVTENEQAERLTRTLEFIRDHLTDVPFGRGMRALPANVQRVYWFSLDDYPSPDGFGNFGLFRSDGTLRPAADALRAFTQ